jgi:CDP-glucose 4,6-dehydratase
MRVTGYDWRNRRVLVTGASGFKGAWLSAVLLRLGARVYGTVRNRIDTGSSYSLLALDCARNFHPLPTDVLDRRDLDEQINRCRPEVVFHLAGVATVPDCNEDPRRAFDVNVGGAVNLLEACRRSRFVKRLLLCSTDLVFGPVAEDEIPLPEDSSLGIGAPYETSKACMEMWARTYYDTYRAELPLMCVTRSANVFGYGDTAPRRVIPRFIGGGINSGKVVLTARRNGRQFVHVSDAVAGYVLAVSALDRVRDEADGCLPTFHFAIEHYEYTDRPFLRIGKLAQVAAEITGAVVEEDEDCVDYMPNENPVQGLSCSRTAELLGWKPAKEFGKALAELAEWYRLEKEPGRRAELIRAEVERAVLSIREPVSQPAVGVMTGTCHANGTAFS